MLAGRDAERARIHALLAGARTGGAALVIRGVAGSGKSSLLTDAATTATGLGMTVLRTQGVESESPLAFAALQRLLRPVRPGLAALPAPQRAALGAALGEADGSGERFLAFLGTLSLLADAADDRPVLAVVDDAHWLDDASAAALLFVARRLQAERVALLFAARDDGRHRFEARDLPELTLAGITADAAGALLADHAGGPVDPAVRDELVIATGGNPLALVEVAAALTGDQLAGRQPLPTPLPLTDGVERGFLDRYSRLSGPAQRFLLVTAADDTGRLPVILDAATHLGINADAVDEVERAGLLQVDGGVVALYHPLVRSAVYRAAGRMERRAAHRALATVLAADPDRRAWHAAAATDRPDDTVVADLDAVAERAAGRGGHEEAAAAWNRAAELTSGGEDRGRRLFLAASSSWLADHPSRAAALAAAADPAVADPALRARLLILRAQIEWNTRSVNDGFDLVLQALQLAAGTDPPLAQQLAMLASSLAAYGARSPRPVDPVALVPAPAADAPPRERAAFHLLHGFTAVTARDWPTAVTSFRSAFALTDDHPVDDHVLQPNLAIAALLIDDDERSLRLHEDQLTAARRAGALNMVEHALTRGFQSQIATGAWTAAAGAAAEALPLAVSTGHPGLTATPTAELALVAALRGEDAADRHLAEVADIRNAHPLGISEGLVADATSWASALRTADQPATALHHLLLLTGAAMRRLAALDVIDTANRCGRTDVVAEWVTELAAFADGTGCSSAVAVTEHGRAVLAGAIPAAEEHYRRALAAHDHSLRVPDRARTHLAFGEYLRRARRRVDAREQLRTALALFEQLGAAPLAQRAAQELRASGETARRRDPGTADELTPQERQVAALVAQGLSNRDAAAQLFVSPRTVDFHLRNVFGKLGVSSRAELAARSLT